MEGSEDNPVPGNMDVSQLDVSSSSGPTSGQENLNVSQDVSETEGEDLDVSNNVSSPRVNLDLSQDSQLSTPQLDTDASFSGTSSYNSPDNFMELNGSGSYRSPNADNSPGVMTEEAVVVTPEVPALEEIDEPAPNRRTSSRAKKPRKIFSFDEVGGVPVLVEAQESGQGK